LSSDSATAPFFFSVTDFFLPEKEEEEVEAEEERRGKGDGEGERQWKSLYTNAERGFFILTHLGGVGWGGMTQSTVLKYRDGNFYDKDGKEVTATGARIVPVDMGNASHKTPSPRQPVSAVSTQLEESGSSSASTTGSPFATQIVHDLA